MPHKVYHGDPSRDHHFWVYPSNKTLINPQWDAHDPNQLCNNYSLVDGNQFTDVRTYQCNGHSNESHGAGGYSHHGFHANITGSHEVYHGDPSRDHQFWIYPSNKRLINPQWDAHDPTDLCNNFSVVDVNQSTEVVTYQCNGHSNESHGAGGYSHHGFHANITGSHRVYHGDPSRDHHFWIYPSNQALMNPEWDAYDPTELCNNFSEVDVDRSTHIRTYKCNGH